MTKTPLFPVVAAALVDRDGRVLLQRRAAGGPIGGMWEFPGGKVEPGETPEAALARELAEELGIRIDPAALVPAGFASAPLGDRHLLLLLFATHLWEGTPRALAADALAWIAPTAMAELPMPPPDYPLAANLALMLARTADG